MAMGIAVGEEAALQHLVGGGTDAPAWSVPVQGRLLNFGEVIFGIAIQGNSADRYQRVLASDQTLVTSTLLAIQGREERSYLM